MSDNGPSSARYQALIQLLRTAEDLWNASRVFFSRWDLSPSQFNVLNVLHGQVDGLSQSELSRLLIMHRSNATGLIDRLEKRRLVQRTEDAQDRRAYRVVLTPEGLDLINRIYPHYYAAAAEVWASMADERVVAFLGELQDLATQATQVASRHTEATSQPKPGTHEAEPTTSPLSRSTEKPSPLTNKRRRKRAQETSPAEEVGYDSTSATEEGLRTSDL
jgi:DNA-binding MarR family transcriptional regulator